MMPEPLNPHSSTHPGDASTNAVTDAMQVLYVFDQSGTITGSTEEYKTYQALKQAYLDAQGAYATAYSTAMNNASQLQLWPITSKSLQAAVDNAYSEWRSSNAARIESALEIVRSAGQLKSPESH